MKTTTTNPQRSALVTAALTLACFATLARAASSAAPIITPVVDAAALAKAKAKGDALLAKPKWKAELKNTGGAGVDLLPAGDALQCVGMDARKHEVHTTVLDSRTGRLLWEMIPKQLLLTATWSDGGLLGFETDDGKLKLLRWSAATPNGVSQWETTYAPPGTRTGGVPDIRALPTFADQQIIIGEQSGPFGGLGGGGFGRGNVPKPPLTIRSFDRKTGKVQWETPVPTEAAMAEVKGVAQGRVYILVTDPQSARFYMALNAADGKLLWKMESNPDLLESAFQGAVFYTLSRTGELVAYNGQTGKETWHTTLSRVCDPAKPASASLSGANLFADNEGIYAYFSDYDFKATDRARENAKAEGGIAVLDPKTGKQTGYFNGKGFMGAENQSVGGLTVQGNLLLAAVANRGWIAIDRKTLQLQWNVFPGQTVHGVMSNGMLFFNTSARQEEPQRILAVEIGQK